MEFCDWLTRKRLELSARMGRRVTQAEVAKKAGISRSYVSFLETGVNPTTGKPVAVDRDMVLRLADALDVEPEDALYAAGFGERLSDEERELLRRYRKLPPEQEEAFRRMLEAIVPRPKGSQASGMETERCLAEAT
jgi:transcriptional regulator with XRE-family HTH domain